mmetsp:Transcript_380/g.688  ORF Transcript_380/g.688 Transcript_380/m.688 type:complete len:84 (+) Transcript_380:265-516(+)
MPCSDCTSDEDPKGERCVIWELPLADMPDMPDTIEADSPHGVTLEVHEAASPIQQQGSDESFSSIAASSLFAFCIVSWTNRCN